MMRLINKDFRTTSINMLKTYKTKTENNEEINGRHMQYFK